MSEEEQSTTVIEKVDIPEVICIGIGCGKPGKMACPTCISKGLPTSPFCSQDCFKSNWDTHKNVHKKQKADNDLPTGFKNYQFSGELRPWQQSPKYKVPDHIQKPDYADHPQGKSLSEDNDKKTNTSIPVYTAEQIAGIREACQIGRFVLDAGGAAVKEGVTCDEIDRVVFEATISKNAYPSPLNYYLFPKSVCTSVNEVICHGIPDKRPLKNGDIVNIDVSVYYNGYHGDLNETFMVGDVDEKSYNLVKCAYDSLANAIASVRPGTLYRELGEKISKVTNNAGFSVVQSYCGHGIGKLFHTAPNVPHYAKVLPIFFF